MSLKLTDFAGLQYPLGGRIATACEPGTGLWEASSFLFAGDSLSDLFFLLLLGRSLAIEVVASGLWKVEGTCFSPEPGCAFIALVWRLLG